MGNRAHVIFTDGSDISPAVYLHWNGGPESVYRFLDETRYRMGDRFGDPSYSAARFAQVVGDFMDQDEQGGLSLGVVNGPDAINLDSLAPYDHGDNGVYVVTPQGVRRFADPHYNGTLRELTADEIAAENAEANASDYADALRTFFDGIRPTPKDSQILG